MQHEKKLSCSHTRAENAEVNGKKREEQDLLSPGDLGQTDKAVHGNTARRRSVPLTESEPSCIYWVEKLFMKPITSQTSRAKPLGLNPAIKTFQSCLLLPKKPSLAFGTCSLSGRGTLLSISLGTPNPHTRSDLAGREKKEPEGGRGGGGLS